MFQQTVDKNDIGCERAHSAAVNVIAFALTAVLLVGTAVVIGLLTNPDWFVNGASSQGIPGLIPHSRTGILLRNASVAMLLFSGVVTGGLTTVLGCFTVGAYMGMAISLAIHDSGVATVVATTWQYSVFEFAGFTMAAMGGVYPILDLLLRRRRRQSNGFASYYTAAGAALTYFACALVFLCVGAVTEGFLSLR